MRLYDRMVLESVKLAASLPGFCGVSIDMQSETRRSNLLILRWRAGFAGLAGYFWGCGGI